VEDKAQGRAPKVPGGVPRRNIALPAELYDRFSTEAKSRGVSLAMLTKIAIEKFLSKK